MVTNDETHVNSGFVHLHCHSQYSLLDGLSKIPEMVKKAKDMGQTAIALTDHGVCFGLVEFYDECKKQDIKPILGCEFYYAPTDRALREPVDDERYYHLILLVKNEVGYKNLCHLVTRANTQGFYYKPRIDWQLLKEFHEGLICLSGCIQGEVAKKILKGKAAEASKTVDKFKELFKDDYYLEIQNHGLNDERIAYAGVIKLAQKKGIKLVCTNDSHYVNSEDAEAHEWLLVLQQNKEKSGGEKITLNDPHMVYKGDYSLKSEKEMRELFPEFPEAISNTVEVAEKCNFDFQYGDYRMPTVHIPKEFGVDYYGYLESEALKGFDVRYAEDYPDREKVRDRLKYELSVVKQMDFSKYFIDTRKTIMWARSHDILVGPGRGSAAGSVMCYCLYITDIDPIRYELLFERFLNPERISMPDIDVDYDYAHKEEIIAFEAQSNGKDKFAKICTFMGMNAKSVLKDCCRINGLPTSIGNEFASFIPDEVDITLKKAYEDNPGLRAYIANAKPVIKHIWEIALRLEGTKKSQSTHACGHIPTPIPCEDLFPSILDKESGYLACQYDMAQAEHLGNLKKDLLMLRNLTIIDVARREVKKRYKIDVPLWNEEILYDKGALEMISRGETLGVFQLEGDGMTAFMMQLKPDTFEDIIAGVALYRPGPMDFIPQYILGKKNPSAIKYTTPQLEPILKNTYGVIVYQEQVMQIVQALAGYTRGRSDVLRKAMGKKKMDIMLYERNVFIYGNQAEIDEARAKGKKEPVFVPGCIANGISEDIANSIFDQMVDFAKYAFNKSHAACYAAIGMQTAYLKNKYPLEFMAGLLSSVMDDPDKFAPYMSECKKLGVKINNPDLNMSGSTFSVDGENLRFGLSCVKGITISRMESIIKERKANGEFVSITDFVTRCPDIKKNNVKNLIDVGAFDFTGSSRRAMNETFEAIISKVKDESKKQVPGQMNLFDFFGDVAGNPLNDDIPDMPEYTAKELRDAEKEAAGVYISSSPLDDFRDFIDVNVDTDSVTIKERKNETIVAMAGFVTKKKITRTKKDNSLMAIYEIEDDFDKYKAVVFPTAFEAIGCGRIDEGNVVWLTGKVNLQDGKADLIVSDMKIIEEIPEEYVLRVDRNMPNQISNRSFPPGRIRVAAYLVEDGQILGVRYFNSVDDGEKTFNGLRNIVGNGNIVKRRMQQLTHSYVTGKTRR